MAQRPARARDAVVAEVADGAIVYDSARGRVHYLNHTAAAVLELCDGANSDADISSRVQSRYDLRHPPADEVSACLQQLRDEGLVS